MTASADVAIVGLGVIGLSTARSLARRGLRVVGIDRFGSGHPATSSTGPSRSMRLAYDQPFYVELAREAIERWRRLERDVDVPLLRLTGQLDLGPGTKLEALVTAMSACGVPVEELDARAVDARFPELRVRPGERSLFHRDAGTVIADAAMRAIAADAERAGASLWQREAALAIAAEDGGATVTTDRDRTIRAATVVIAAGPWLGAILADLGLAVPLAPSVAQVSFVGIPSLEDRPGLSEWMLDDHGVGVYGHPVPGVGYKVAFDAGSAEPWDPDAEAWEPDPLEAEALARWVGDRLPSASGHVVRHQRHPWTITPDGDFVIDRHGPMVVAGGCSGHAFKFGPALGELIADLVEGTPRPGTDRFALDRPSLRSATADPTAPIVR